MPSSASSSSSSSLYIVGASSPRRPVDPVRVGSDTDDDGSGGGGSALSRPVADRFASSFKTKESLNALCKKYGVPEQYAALPAGDRRACSPPSPGAVCLYAHALEAGMRVPLHGFFSEALSHFDVAPSQVVPNGWRAMAGFIVLSHFAGVPPSVRVFRHFFSLCVSKIRGWYSFRGKETAGALFTGLPHSIKGWKEGFFFLKSPTPWPCPVKWGELSKSATAEPVLNKEEKSMAAKLLRAHGTAVDLKTYLCESNLAAAKITCAPPTPPPHSPHTAGAKGRDMRAEKAAAMKASAENVTVKSEARGDTPSSEKKRKLVEEDVKPDIAHGSVSGTSSPPGFSTQKPPKSGGLDHVRKPRYVPDRHDGDTADWEAARQLLEGTVTPSRERSFAAARPSDIIASGYVTILQAANYASFSLGHALELEEKLAARERDADALRQELAKAKAELTETKKAAAAEKRSTLSATSADWRT